LQRKLRKFLPNNHVFHVGGFFNNKYLNKTSCFKFYLKSQVTHTQKTTFSLFSLCFHADNQPSTSKHDASYLHDADQVATGGKLKTIGFHTATWDVEGAFLDQDPDDVDRIFTNRKHPVALGCLQNTGSPVATLETENYVWRVSKVQPRPQYDMLNSGGTAFLFHKQHMAEFESLDFFKITDDIVGCEFRFGGRRMRVISAYIGTDRTADPEFSALIEYLLDNRAPDVTTIVMGNLNAEIGKRDQFAMGGSSQLGQQLMHDQSNHNGVLLTGLLEMTGFMLSSSFSESETTLETWATRDRAAQLDHILQSQGGGVRVEELKARYIDRIRTHHKCMFARVVVGDRPREIVSFEGPGFVKRKICEIEVFVTYPDLAMTATFI
jgi:hypothetical protein